LVASHTSTPKLYSTIIKLVTPLLGDGGNMTRNLEKYLHKQMDKEAGLEHTFHRTKIVATVGPL